MNTLVAVAIAPFGEGDELAEYVAEVVRLFANLVYPTKHILCSPKLKVSGMR